MSYYLDVSAKGTWWKSQQNSWKASQINTKWPLDEMFNALNEKTMHQKWTVAMSANRSL